MHRTHYFNARLLDPSVDLDVPGGLLVEGSFILDCGPHLQHSGAIHADSTIDCRNMALAPGLVDMRTHLREPGFAHRETLRTTGLLAASGGVTSVAGLPGTDPLVDNEAALAFVLNKARTDSAVKIYPYATATAGAKGTELVEYGLMSAAGAIAFTDGEHAVSNAGTLRRIMQYTSMYGLLLIQRPEDPSLAKGVATSGELATRMGLSGIPPEAEVILLERDLRLVAMTGARYHASLISTADSVEAIRQAKAKGLSVTCDTAPPYFTLNELAISGYNTSAKLSPPLRSESDRKAVITGLMDGTIDAIVSDHAPQNSDAKDVPFARAACGGLGLETLLPLTLGMVHDGSMPILRSLALLSLNPARILGLKAGKLAAGYPADLIVVDLDKPWKYSADKSCSGSRNSPFDGHLLQGRVLRTIVDGKTIYVHGT
ncbi:dihydroorotase [Haematospirillum sp. 15-248]|uniref:dihydroorotase n=1 Tax=Haematospirillum sp. 15-248 TaxID=2723107 RepID=UPI00143C2C86|nr:dihydroorotase [Haematospirillum sp. 15-248]NKD86866.1 dihydroorotase [Haematospirillum sp. 15-248]